MEGSDGVNENPHALLPPPPTPLNLCTKRHCFLCLKPSENFYPCSPTTTAGPPPLFQHLCKYLQIDIGGIAREFIEMPAIIESMGLSSIDDQTEIKVTLCLPCRVTVERFSRLFHELERIRKEMGSCLDTIKCQISSAEQDPEILHTYRTIMAGGGESLLLSVIIDRIKKEILLKCSQPPSTGRSLPADCKPSSSTPASSVEGSSINSDSNINENIIRNTDVHDSINELEVDDDSDNDYNPSQSEASETKEMYECPECPNLFLTKGGRSSHYSYVHAKIRRKKSGSSQTPSKKRKKCAEAFCAEEFQSSRLASQHYNNTHRKKFKCTRCNREDFKFNSELSRHESKCDGSRKGRGRLPGANTNKGVVVTFQEAATQVESENMKVDTNGDAFIDDDQAPIAAKAITNSISGCSITFVHNHETTPSTSSSDQQKVTPTTLSSPSFVNNVATDKI